MGWETLLYTANSKKIVGIKHNTDITINKKSHFLRFLFKNWFMLSVRISSYGCTREGGEHERSVRVARGAAESNSSFLRIVELFTL